MQTIYNELILKEEGEYKATYTGGFGGFYPEHPFCDFCGHKTASGYEVTDIKTAKILIVGCDCFGNLLKLPKEKMKIIKHKEALRRNLTKYSQVVEFLKTYNGNYSQNRIKDEIIRKATTTTTVNFYWIEEFKRLTQIDLNTMILRR